MEAGWQEDGTIDGGKSPKSRQNQSSQQPTYPSDWHIDSILLFAENACSLLGEEDPPINPNAPNQVICRLIRQFMDTASQAYVQQSLAIAKHYIQPQSSRAPLLPRPFTGSGQLTTLGQSFERNEVITIIGDAWQTLMRLVSSFLFLKQDDLAYRQLSTVIREVEKNIIFLQPASQPALHLRTILNLPRINGVTLLPHFGQHYELIRFGFAEDIAILGIPVTALYCPWEWTFIWHEIGGLYVQEYRDDPTSVIAHVKQALAEIVADQLMWQTWQSQYPEIKRLLDQQNVLSDTILKNWAEELVEDAIGTLCLGSSMADTLKIVLHRYYREGSSESAESEAVYIGRPDDRHPPIPLRIAVARTLSQLLLRQDDGGEHDVAVRKIANTVYAHRQVLVVKPFDLDDHQELEECIKDLDQEKLSRKFDSHILVAAAVQAAYNRRIDGGRIRQAVYGAKTAYVTDYVVDNTIDYLRLLATTSDPGTNLSTDGHYRLAHHYLQDALVTITGLTPDGTDADTPGVEHNFRFYVRHKHKDNTNWIEVHSYKKA